MSTEADAGTRRVEYVDLDAIQPALRNPKQHDTAGISRSIAAFGLGELPLLDERTGRMVAGHGRVDELRAARDSGQTPPDGVRLNPDGKWQIPLIRGWASRSDADAEAYVVASNNLTTRGGWDEEELGQLLSDLNDIDPDLLAVTGFTQEELDAILEQGDDPDDDPPADNDDPPPPPEDPVTVLGDLWILGEHRVLCGDSLNPDDIDRALGGAVPGIIYTDPPYGISIVNATGKIGHATQNPGGHAPTTKYLPVAGDSSPQVAGDAFRLLTSEFPKAHHVWWGGNHYVASAGLADSSCWLVWDKENGEVSFADVELAWTNATGAARLLRHQWHGMIRATERGTRVHPTQKPVALARWAFGVIDPKAEASVVLDAFGGSGSTLIAAHETGRTAVVLEAEPAYVDVICQRWQKVAGVLPVLEATGEQVSFIPDDGES